MKRLSAPRELSDQQVRRKKKRFTGDVPVYVDGKFVTVLRYSELPASLPSVWAEAPTDNWTIQFSWKEYLRTLGLEPGTVKELHVHGSKNKVSAASGAAVAGADRLYGFSFTRQHRGQPRFRTSPKKVEFTQFIDRIVAVSIYVEKEPPKTNGMRVTLNGKRLKQIAYTDGQKHGGTRVYVDSKYQAIFRRRELLEGLLVRPGTYSLARTLAFKGVQGYSAKVVEFISRKDEVVGRWSGEKWERLLKETGFELKQHSRGRITIPSVFDGPLELIRIYDQERPRDRTVRTVAESIPFSSLPRQD